MRDSRYSLCRDLETTYGFPSILLDTSIVVINPPVRQYVILGDDRVRLLLETPASKTCVPDALAPLVRTPPPAKTHVRARVVSLLGDMPEREIIAILRSLPAVFPQGSTIEFVFDADSACISADLLIGMLTAVTAIRAPAGNRVAASIQICAPARAIPTDPAFLDVVITHKAILRPVLVPAGAVLEDADVKAISTLAEYGLRVPPLLYHTGQDATQTKALLRQALSASLSSGVGLLPSCMSPWESLSCRPAPRSGDFVAAAKAAYRDNHLAEFLLEPIADCEDRLQHAHDSRYASFLVRPGGLAPFLQLSSTARRKCGRTIDGSALPAELSAGTSSRRARCELCTLREICGSIDDTIREAQGRTVCAMRETFFRLFLKEAICVSEALTQPLYTEAA